MSETKANSTEAAMPVPTTPRDGQGRFLTGNSGGGRRKGSRNKLAECFLDAVADDFAEHGTKAISQVRATDPATYLKMIGSLLPRELILQREQSPLINWDEVTYEELASFVEDRRRRLSMEHLLMSIE
jgi:hypothetical protein